MKKKAEPATPVNLLTLVPAQNTRWEKDENGKIILLKPKFKHPLLIKHVMPRVKRRYYRIKLDDIGSFFWENCDGRQSVQEIAKKHLDRFGEKVEPLYDRISVFLQTLERHGFISYRNLERIRVEIQDNAE